MLPALGGKGKEVPAKKGGAKNGNWTCENCPDAAAEQKGRIEAFGLFQGEVLIEESPKND